MKIQSRILPLLVAFVLAAGCQTSRHPIPLESPVPAPPPPPPAAVAAAAPVPATPVAGGTVDRPRPAPTTAEPIPAAFLFQRHGIDVLPVSENALANIVKAQLGAESFAIADPRDVLGDPLPETSPADIARKCNASVLVSASVTDARIRAIGGPDAGCRAVFELSLSAVDAATGANLAPVNAKRESRKYHYEGELRADADNIWIELARAAAADASAKLRADWAAVRPPTAAETVRVTFASNIPGANVKIGGISYGTTGSAPLVLELPAGVHYVEIAYPGYVAFKDRAMVHEGSSFAAVLSLNAEGRAALERDAGFRLQCERIEKSGLTDDLAKELVARGYSKYLEASHTQLQGMPRTFIPVTGAPDLGLAPLSGKSSEAGFSVVDALKAAAGIVE